MTGMVGISGLALVVILTAQVMAQEDIKHPDTEPWSSKVPYSQLNSSNFNPRSEPNIDLYSTDWRDSMPVFTHSGLVERYIFTRSGGDSANPSPRGAILKGVSRFSHATLRTHTSTTPTTLKGEQEVFYVLSGRGAVSGGGKTYDIFPGIVVLIPEDLEYSMRNMGYEAVMMYMIVEPVPAGFQPRKDIVIHDEAAAPVAKTNDHWNNSTKILIAREEGLAVIDELLAISLPARSMSQPFSYVGGVEAVYCTVQGEPLYLSGKQIRALPPGSAYMVVPNAVTPHANINLSDAAVKYLYFGLLTR